MKLEEQYEALKEKEEKYGKLLKEEENLAYYNRVAREKGFLKPYEYVYKPMPKNEKREPIIEYLK